MSKKAIFFVKNFIVGGVENVFVSAVNALISDGWSITIVWIGSVEENHLYDKLSPKVEQIIPSKTLKIIQSKSFIPRFIKNLFSNIDVFIVHTMLAKLIPDFSDFDYVIDFKNGSSLVYKLNLQPHQRRIVWLHGAFHGFEKKNKLKRKKIFSYDKIVCLTQDFKDQFINIYPEYKNKIICIYNPFDLSEKEINEAEYKETQKYAPYFVHVSRIDVDKDILTMIKAYEQFYLNTNSNKKLVFVGSGKLLNHYQEIVKKMGLSDKIFFYGLSKSPFDWMKNAEALILSSYSEGLPTVLIEGQINNTLVVSSDCKEGPAEICDNGNCGILFPVGDINKLAQILCDIENNVINKSKYTKRAKELLPRFAPETFVNKFNLLGR